MTQIRLGLVKPLADGTLRQAAGQVHLRPHARQSTAAEPTDIILPATFTVSLKSDQPAPVVELAPGYWKGIESTAPAGLTRLVLVPDSPEVVDWADLVDVDPETLEPSEPAVPAWEAAVAAVTVQADRATGAASDADGSAGLASDSADSASASAADAEAALATFRALTSVTHVGAGVWALSLPVTHLGGGQYSITTGA